MSRRVPPTKALIAFDAVVRLKSVTDAANEVHVTSSAITHQIRNLETFLGQKLFTRANGFMELTPFGEKYHGRISQILGLLDDATALSKEKELTREILTIQCTPSFATAWLVPNIHSFISENPEIDVRIHSLPYVADFSRGEADVDIRYGGIEKSGLMTIPIFKDKIIPMASPGYLRKHPFSLTAYSLMNESLIISERSPIDWATWFRQHGIMHHVKHGLRFDRGHLACQAAAEGLGIVLESEIFASQQLQTHELVPIFDDTSSANSFETHHSVVYPHSSQNSPKIRAFCSWISQHVNTKNAVN